MVGGSGAREAGDGAAARLGLGLVRQNPAGPRERGGEQLAVLPGQPREPQGHLYAFVEWKMLSASLASTFHLEFGRLLPLLEESPPMPRVGLALRCARVWEPARVQGATLLERAGVESAVLSALET